MKRLFGTIVVVLAELLVGCAAPPAIDTVALASDVPKLSASGEPADAAPATQPASLPKGHPDISKLMTENASHGQAPAGSGTPTLPKGHPDISKLATGASTQPVTGNITVRAVQGTAGGPAIGIDPVVVEVYANSQLIGKLETKLETDGTVRIDNIPTGAGYQVVAHVTHAGVDFEANCDANSGEVQLSVPVFESTDQKPDWSVQMRHAIVQPAEGGVRVMEVLAILNPADRAWVGDAPDADGKRTTFVLPLPSGASDVQLGGGFHECCAKVADGRITNTMALLPGVTQYQFSYVVPVHDGKVQLVTSAPAPVKTMMVLLPEAAAATAEGLEGPKTANMGNGNTQYFKAANVPANKQVKLTIDVSSMKNVKQSSTVAVTEMSSSSPPSAPNAFDAAAAAKAIGGVGALLILLLGASFMLMKSPRNVRSSRPATHS